MMEFIMFVSQDARHFCGFAFVVWMAFLGIEMIVKAARGKDV